MSSFIERGLPNEQKLWDAIPSVPDLQYAVLFQCAGPRCHHLLRTGARGCSSQRSLCWDTPRL